MLQDRTAALAPAKINLALHVTGRRDDGYHLLESLVVFTRFGDRLTIAPSDADGFEIAGPYAAGLPADGVNLALRARDAMRAAFGRSDPVHIHLEKNLPVASGVGGGSSDAAAVIATLARLWELPADADLARIGLALGADVPMCLVAAPLVARGVGDEIEPVPGLPGLGVVLVNPGVGLSTAEVFQALRSPDNAPLPPLPSPLDFSALVGWLKTTRNDLEAPARRTQRAIGPALDTLRRAGASFSRMSGSGATCFGLFESGNAAKRAAIEIRKSHPDWFVAATRTLDAEGGPA